MHHRFMAATIAVLACVACGSSSSGANVSAFVGTWQYTTGTETDTCNGQSSTQQITGTFQLAEGTAAGTIEYIGTGGCTFTLDVSGDTATAVAGSTCTQSATDSSNGATETILETLTSATATLNGATLSVNWSASAMVNENGATEDCTSVRTATLTQIAK